jgi:hypothetical protein
MAATTTSSDTSFPSHYQSHYLRQIPHYRTCLPTIARCCNPFVNPVSLRLRHIAFLCIIVLRIIEILLFTLVFYMRKPIFLVPGVLLMLAIFFLVAWNLHLIVEAGGERRLYRLRIPSGAFSAFLWIVVVVHVVLVGLEVTGLSFYVDGTQKTWMFWILVICLVAWVTGREPEEGSLILA